MDADNFIETAKPPASSSEELIREPLESLCKLFCRFTFVLPRLYAAMLEAVLVLIVIIFVFLYLLFCFAASVPLRAVFLWCSTSPSRVFRKIVVSFVRFWSY
jgi:hypothetical protein